MTAANDNKVNPEWVEVVRICRAFRQLYGVELLKHDGMNLRHRDPRSVANFLWFCKFEMTFHEKMREENRRKTRAKLRIVSQNA